MGTECHLDIGSPVAWAFIISGAHHGIQESAQCPAGGILWITHPPIGSAKHQQVGEATIVPWLHWVGGSGPFGADSQHCCSTGITHTECPQHDPQLCDWLILLPAWDRPRISLPGLAETGQSEQDHMWCCISDPQNDDHRKRQCWQNCKVRKLSYCCYMLWIEWVQYWHCPLTTLWTIACHHRQCGKCTHVTVTVVYLVYEVLCSSNYQ